MTNGFSNTAPGKTLTIGADVWYIDSNSGNTNNKFNMSIYADGNIVCNILPSGAMDGTCNWTVPAMPKPGLGKAPYSSYTYNLQVKASDSLGNVVWSEKVPITSVSGRTR